MASISVSFKGSIMNDQITMSSTKVTNDMYIYLNHSVQHNARRTYGSVLNPARSASWMSMAILVKTPETRTARWTVVLGLTV